MEVLSPTPINAQRYTQCNLSYFPFLTNLERHKQQFKQVGKSSQIKTVQSILEYDKNHSNLFQTKPKIYIVKMQAT